MKRLLLSLFLFGILFTSCTKEKVDTNQYDYTAEVSFSVGEQQNVSHYVVEASTDGNTFEDAGVVFASNKLEDTYTITINITRFVEKGNNVYFRAKSVDIDGAVDYSKVSMIRN